MNPTAFLPHLLRTSAQAGVLVLIVLLAQWLFRRQLSPRWRCALWLLLVVRLALPWSPASPTSLFNLLPVAATPAAVSAFSLSRPVVAVPPEAILSRAVAATDSISPAAPTASLDVALTPPEIPAAARQIPEVSREAAKSAKKTSEPMPPALREMTPVLTSALAPAPLPPPPHATAALLRSLPWPEIAARIWLAGVAILAVLLAVSTLRLDRRLRRSRPLQDENARAILEQCRQKLGLASRPELVESDAVSSPALYGVFRPRLLLPQGFTARFSPAQLRLVFCHELAHLRRRDLLLNWLIAGLQILHWFNPLVWIGFSRWRADRELACDAIVLEAVGADQNREYGATILRLLETFTRRAPLPGFVGILEDKTRLRRRLEMIAQFRPSPRWSVGSMALLAGIAALCLTEARSVMLPAVPPLPASRSLSVQPQQRLPQTLPDRLAPTPAADIPAVPSVAQSTDAISPTLAPVAPPPIGPIASDTPTAAELSSPTAVENISADAPKIAAQEPIPTPAAPPTVQPSAVPAPSTILMDAKDSAPRRPATPAPSPTLTFFVLGDSLAADLREPADGWGSALGNYFNPAQVQIRNVSRAGVDSRSYRNLGYWDQVLAQIRPDDVVFIQFNDNGTQSPTSPGSIGALPGAGEETREIVGTDRGRETVHTQGWYLRSYIRDVRRKGAVPMLLTSTRQNAWGSYEEVMQGRWRETPDRAASAQDKVTLAVGNDEKVQVIDLARLSYFHYRLLGRELVERLFEKEGDHLNRYGADLNAYLVVSGLKSIPEIAKSGPWSTVGTLVIPATAKVNVPIRTDWYDTTPGAVGQPGGGVILTSLNRGPDFTALYGDDRLNAISVEPPNDALPTIFMVGDEAVRGGRGVGAGNQWGWGDLIANYLDQEKVNLVVGAVPGFSSRSYLTHGSWLMLRQWIQRRDIVLIGFGHYESTPIEDQQGRGTLPGIGNATVETTQFPHGRNFDERNIHRGRETVFTYGAYLRTYLAEVKKAGALPILISPTPRNHWKDGKIVRDPELVSETAQVAKEAGVPFFDLNSMLADRYDAMGQAAAERCFADPDFVTNYAGARLAAESVVKLLFVQNPGRMQNFLNPTVAISFRGEQVKPTTSDNSKPFGQVMTAYRAIDKGMSKADVVARLGAPDRTSRDLSIYWKQGPFSLNRTPYIELDVVYDQQDRVVQTKFLQGTDRDTIPSDFPTNF